MSSQGIEDLLFATLETVADLPDRNFDRDLAEAEAEIAETKQAYYDALSRRHRALRALAREGGDE